MVLEYKILLHFLHKNIKHLTNLNKGISSPQVTQAKDLSEGGLSSGNTLLHNSHDKVHDCVHHCMGLFIVFSMVIVLVMSMVTVKYIYNCV